MSPQQRASFAGPQAAEQRVWRGHLALIAVQVMFGLFPVFGSLAFRPGGFSPFAVACWRLSLGALLLSALALARSGKRMRLERRDIGRLLLCGLLGIAANQGLFLVGLERSTPANASLIICLIPIFTVTIAALLGQESFHWLRALGVLSAFIGLCPLFLGRGAELGGEHLLGNTLIASNALAFAIYLVISKPLLARYPPLVLIAWTYLFALVSLPFFAWRTPLLPSETANWGAWGSLAYILVFPTVLAYLLNIYALSRVRASTTAFYIYLQPLCTIAASWAFLGERLTPQMGQAAIGIFVAILLVARR